MRGNTLEHTIAHHDAQITTLGGRMSSMESGLQRLQGEVHTGFSSIQGSLSALTSKLDRQEARPEFNFHQSVSTVLALAVLFSMVVGGIIWVTQSQFASVVAEQKGTNTAVSVRLEKHEAVIEKLAERVGWVAKTDGKQR